jgi:acetyl esterase/lipase
MIGTTMNCEIFTLDCDYAAAGIPEPVHKPTLHAYILDTYTEITPDRVRPALIICPGGGYGHLSPREGEPVAIRFNALGFNAFVLKYSCAPAVYPAPQLELASALGLVRARAAEWRIDEKKIIAAGFSAGAHLAASLGVFWNDRSIFPGFAPASIRPDALLLSYPVITSGQFAHRGSFENLLGGQHKALPDDARQKLLDLVSLENQVGPDTPPAFIWHTWEDASVPAENSLLFAQALRRAGKACELHLYQRGPHGMATANEETVMANGSGIQAECQNWVDMAAAWIRKLGS